MDRSLPHGCGVYCPACRGRRNGGALPIRRVSPRLRGARRSPESRRAPGSRCRAAAWAISSGEEHLPYKQGVGGSNPPSPTTLPFRQRFSLLGADSCVPDRLPCRLGCLAHETKRTVRTEKQQGAGTIDNGVEGPIPARGNQSAPRVPPQQRDAYTRSSRSAAARMRVNSLALAAGSGSGR